jgi:hypothetical protein
LLQVLMDARVGGWLVGGSLYDSIRDRRQEDEQASLGHRAQGAGSRYTPLQGRELAARVFEVHPEVSFSAWAGKPMRYSKKKATGRLDRRKLILAEWPDAITSCQAMLAGERYEVDDLYDAFAALWTARRISAKKARAIPSISPRDANGLPMKISV